MTKRSHRLCPHIQELCISWGGHPGPPVPNSPYGLCGRKAKSNVRGPELRSCVKVEVAVLDSPSLIVRTVSGRHKATLYLNTAVRSVCLTSDLCNLSQAITASLERQSGYNSVLWHSDRLDADQAVSVNLGQVLPSTRLSMNESASRSPQVRHRQGQGGRRVG